MAAFGNPLAIELGGGPSPQEIAYDALRSAVGVGNSAPGTPEDSVVEAWRWARARGVAAAFAVDRAALQSNPATASDFVGAWEQILQVFSPLSYGPQERREALTERYTREAAPGYQSLLARAQALNPAAQVNIPDRTQTRDTQLGRAFEDHDPESPGACGPAFGIRSGVAGAKCTAFPNFSTDFLFVVLSPPIGSSWSDEDIVVSRKITQMLDEELPSWVDARVYAACGFTLDEDLLDVTAFC